MEFLAVLSALAGLGVLVTLSVIDLRTWLLPNPWVLALALLGIAFHAFLHFSYLSVHEMIYGTLVGGGILYVIRMCGNAYYKQDTLGLGDVKLLSAAGLWLGIEGVVIAMTLGAFAGVVHAIVYAIWKMLREKTPLNLKRLMIPAGPGFCIGIACAWVWVLYDYWS